MKVLKRCAFLLFFIISGICFSQVTSLDDSSMTVLDISQFGAKDYIYIVNNTTKAKNFVVEFNLYNGYSGKWEFGGRCDILGKDVKDQMLLTASECCFNCMNAQKKIVEEKKQFVSVVQEKNLGFYEAIAIKAVSGEKFKYIVSSKEDDLYICIFDQLMDFEKLTKFMLDDTNVLDFYATNSKKENPQIGTIDKIFIANNSLDAKVDVFVFAKTKDKLFYVGEAKFESVGDFVQADDYICGNTSKYLEFFIYTNSTKILNCSARKRNGDLYIYLY